MAAQLSALDATFLELEQADHSAHMHIGAVMVFAGGRPPTPADIRERLTLRLDALPRFRQRLSSPVVGGARFPRWEPDPLFELDHHVRRAAVPAPGGPAELLDWAGDFYSQRLDRERPLWEVVIVEGIEGGRWALATKTHHCLADGVGSVDAAAILLDGPEPPAAREPADRHGGVLNAVRAGLQAATHPLDMAKQAAALTDLLVREELVGAPHTSLNVPMGAHRRLATVGVPLDDLKAIKNALGGTVNDVILAAVTGGLRALLLGRGETPPVSVRAMVPVNVRRAGDPALGNRISSLFVELPVDEGDALAAYARVRKEEASRKRSGQAEGAGTLLALAELAPPVLHAVIARSLFATRLFNLTVTNVPGPQGPIHAFGSRLVDAIPIVPLAAEHSVAVAVLSLDGQVVFCLNCDRDTVPDADVAAEGIAATIDALRQGAVPAAGWAVA
jgi:WS/DGAT/MGAT family acyltransferase